MTREREIEPVYVYSVEWKDDESYMIRRGRIVKQNPRRVLIEWERPDGNWDYKREHDTRYASLHYSPQAAVDAALERVNREIALHEMRLGEYRQYLERIKALASEVLA